MNENKNSEEINDDLFLKNDHQEILNDHLVNQDERYQVDASDSYESAIFRHEKYQKRLRFLNKIKTRDINERFLKQLEDENCELFQITKLQQKRIKYLEKQLNDILGGKCY